MIRAILFILLTGSAIQKAFPQSFDKARLDSYFNTLEANSRFMGGVAISQNGQVIYTKQTGYSDIEHKIKPDDNTKYRIGSISKIFTTVLIFKAVEAGKIKLTDKINTAFPAIRNADRITISDLLYHRSGIHNFTADADYLTWNTEKKSEAEMMEIISKGGSDFEPDTRAEYSNSNFVLLSYLLQRIYKKEYARLLNEQIIKPTGLKNTHFGGKPDIKEDDAYSYSFKGDWVKEAETDMSIPMGAGAIISTPVDLTKFAEALFNGKLISPADLKLMETLKDNYGMGLFKVPFYDRSGYGHTGGIDGFTSVMYHFADGDVSIAITSNGTNFDNNQISIALLSAVYNRPYEIPDFKTFAVSNADLDKYAGVYSSKQTPLKITVSRKDNILMAQATGQSAFPLEATAKDRFKFEPGKIVLEFNPADGSMILKQAGRTVNFSRE